MPALLPDRIDHFIAWLDSQISERGLTDVELARRGGISHAVISRARHGQLPGWEASKGIARGLGLPAEVVFRAAGHLPPDFKTDPRFLEFMDIFVRLTDQQQEEILRIIRYMVHSQKS